MREPITRRPISAAMRFMDGVLEDHLAHAYRAACESVSRQATWASARSSRQTTKEIRLANSSLFGQGGGVSCLARDLLAIGA